MIQPIPLSKCEICRNLPNFRRANLMNGEALSGLDRLIGMEEFKPTPMRATRGLVRCPLCGTRYEYAVETDSMEHSEALGRLPPHEGWKDASPGVLEALHEALNLDLEAPNDDIREYAAGGLMVHYVETGQVLKGIALLGKSDPRVQIGALYAFNRWKLDFSPFIDQIIGHLNAADGRVRDAASCYFYSHPETSEVLERYQDKLLKAISGNPIGNTSIDILNEMAKGGLPIDAVLPDVIRFANDQSQREFLREGAVSILKMVAKKNAEARKKIVSLFAAIGPLNPCLEALAQEFSQCRRTGKPALKKRRT